MMRRRRRFVLIGGSIAVVVLLLVTVAYTALFYFGQRSLNPLQIKIKDHIVKKWEKTIKGQPEEKWVLTDYQSLLAVLNPIERHFVEVLFNSDPRRFGSDGRVLQEESKTDLVMISQQYRNKMGFEFFKISPQYVPRNMFQDLQDLRNHMQHDLGRPVLVLSGWRSGGYQAFLFLSQLGRFKNSIVKSIKAVSFPGYSEHGSVSRPAVDFMTRDGRAGNDFVMRPEYKWLLQNAHRYNFFLSYRRGGSHRFEPWHWHWSVPERK